MQSLLCCLLWYHGVGRLQQNAELPAVSLSSCFHVSNVFIRQSTLQVLPAPDMPARVEMQWHRAQWVLYRLRRAHLDGPPTQPVKALASAGAPLLRMKGW